MRRKGEQTAFPLRKFLQLVTPNNSLERTLLAAENPILSGLSSRRIVLGEVPEPSGGSGAPRDDD